jgi:hypothetical protein
MAQENNPVEFLRRHKQIVPEYSGSAWDHLMKIQDGGQSNRGKNVGRKEHPFDMDAMINFKNHNIHHSTCIETKRDATVGLGFKTDRVSEEYDSACEISFQHTQNDQCEDYWQTGNSYYEVVRESSAPNSRILGIYHVSAPLVFKNVQDDFYYWEIVGDEEVPEKQFANFGDWEVLRMFEEEEGGASEIIAIPRPTSLDRWYGWPDWVSAVSSIELVQCMTQHEFDFFLNRGVPEFLLFILGGIVDQNAWKQLEENLKSHIGIGNAYKSSAFNFSNSDMKVQLEKLGLGERQQGVYEESGFSDCVGSPRSAAAGWHPNSGQVRGYKRTPECADGIPITLYRTSPTRPLDGSLQYSRQR